MKAERSYAQYNEVVQIAIEATMLLHLHFYRKTTGEKSYHIPVGGSNGVGVFGYIDTFQELVSQVNKP